MHRHVVVHPTRVLRNLCDVLLNASAEVNLLCWTQSQAFYQRALDLANSMDSSSDHVDVALAFEYAWHMIFGEPAVNWPLQKCELLKCAEESDGLSSSEDDAVGASGPQPASSTGAIEPKPGGISDTSTAGAVGVQQDGLQHDSQGAQVSTAR